MAGLSQDAYRELADPDVHEIQLECGAADEPAGAGMPAWPASRDESTRFYTRQAWTPAGDLKVEVWTFGNPGLSLVKADRQVVGGEIRTTVRWGAPPGSPLAACVAKLGAEITFHGLPKMGYVVVPR